MFQLFKKEVRENIGRLLALFAIYLVPMAMVLPDAALRRRENYGSGILAVLFMFLTIFCPAFIAMATLTRERSHRTFHTLSALPISPWITFALKIFFGLLQVIIPPAVAFAILIACTDNSDNFPRVWSAAGHLCWSAMIYLWTIALGTRIATEWRAALLGVLVALALFFGGTLSLFFDTHPRHLNLLHLLVLHPGIILNIGDSASMAPLQTYFALQASLALLLITFACWRYQRLATGASWNLFQRAPAATKIQIRPLRSYFFPLLWKVWRESRLIILVSLLVALTVPCLLAIPGKPDFPRSSIVRHTVDEGTLHIYERVRTKDRQSFLSETAPEMVQLSAILAVLAAIILGIGPVARDLRPKLSGFWRSRAIPIRHYFCIQYFGGLAAAILIAALPALAVRAIASAKVPPRWNDYIATMTTKLIDENPQDAIEVQPTGDEIKNWHITRKVIHPHIVHMVGDSSVSNWNRANRLAKDSLYACLTLIPLVYAVAGLLTSVFRRPVYAALLTIGSTAPLWMLPTLFGSSAPGYSLPYSHDIVLSITLPATAIVAWATWRAIRANWQIS